MNSEVGVGVKVTGGSSGAVTGPAVGLSPRKEHEDKAKLPAISTLAVSLFILN